jgi:soluble lytic murein transglycosylase-like protein
MSYAQEVINAANRYGVHPELALRTARQESGFNPASVSGAGARGVMQLMPDTARMLGVNINDTAQNIDGGVRYLRDMLARFKGNHKLALAAYNAGPGRVDDFLKLGRPLPSETTNYVHSITNGGQWSPPAASPPLTPRPVQTQAVTAAEQPAGLLQIPGM